MEGGANAFRPVDGGAAFFEALIDRKEDPLRRLRSASRDAVIPDYRVLVGHRTIAGQELSDLSLRVQYLHLTDELVHRIVQAAPDVVVFLDKSARPVSWFVSELWGLCALDRPEATARIAPRPAFRFLNIDREQWRGVIDPMGIGKFDVGRVPEDAIVGLRRAFIAGDASGRTAAEVWTTPTMLTGKRILVVDEVAVSGDTLGIATALIARAFPAAHVSGVHWMRPRLVTKGQSRFNNQVPVWYRDDTPFGRLVGNRDPVRAAADRSWRVRSAAWFLSLPHAEPDVLGRALKAEIRQLAGEVVHGRVPLIPSFERDDLEERIMAFTGHPADQLRAWREANQIILNP